MHMYRMSMQGQGKTHTHTLQLRSHWTSDLVRINALHSPPLHNAQEICQEPVPWQAMAAAEGSLGPCNTPFSATHPMARPCQREDCLYRTQSASQLPPNHSSSLKLLRRKEKTLHLFPRFLTCATANDTHLGATSTSFNFCKQKY